METGAPFLFKSASSDLEREGAFLYSISYDKALLGHLATDGRVLQSERFFDFPFYVARLLAGC